MEEEIEPKKGGGRINAVENRIEALQEATYFTDDVLRVVWECEKLDWERRTLLNAASIDTLCKSVLMKNVACSVTNCDNARNSQFYIVVLQYTAVLDGQKLFHFVKDVLCKKEIARQFFKFHLADDAESKELMGFRFNACAPIATRKKIPVILSSSIAELPGGFFWMGGGHESVKLGMTISDFCKATKCFIADLTEYHSVFSRKSHQRLIIFARMVSEEESEKIREVLVSLGDLPSFSIVCPSSEGYNVIFVVGRYRCACLNPKDFSVTTNAHFYDLTSVTIDKSEISFDFGDGSKISLVELDDEVSNEILRQFFPVYSVITHGWPEHKVCRYVVKWDVDLAFEQPHAMFGGFRESYVAYCNYLKAPIARCFVEGIERCVKEKTLDMSRFLDGRVNIDEERTSDKKKGRRNSSAGTPDLRPIIEALKHNVFFTRLVVTDPIFPHLLQDFVPMLASNTTISELCLSGAKVSNSDLTALSNMIVMSENPMAPCSITHLNLSNDWFGDSGVKKLVPLLTALPLRAVIFSNCGIQADGVRLLCDALTSSLHGEDQFCMLDLSSNQISTKGTGYLCTMLYSRTWKCLTHLILSKAYADVPALLKSLASYSQCVPSLKHLDLSGNEIGEIVDRGKKRKSEVWESKADLAKHLVCLKKLEFLGLARTSITSQELLWLTDELLRHRHVERSRKPSSRSYQKGFSLNVAGNWSTVRDDHTALRQALKFSRHTLLTAILLNDNRVGGDTLVSCLRSLRGNSCLTHLSIGANYKYSARDAVGLARMVGDLLLGFTRLETLCLRGDGGKEYYWGEGLAVLVETLRSHKTLKSLDIRRNAGGIAGASALVVFLSRPTLVQTLYWDENGIPVGKIVEVIEKVEFNVMLTEMEFPVKDAEATKTSSARRLMSDAEETLQSYLFRNRELVRLNLPPPYAVAVGQHTPTAAEQREAKEAEKKAAVRAAEKRGVTGGLANVGKHLTVPGHEDEKDEPILSFRFDQTSFGRNVGTVARRVTSRGDGNQEGSVRSLVFASSRIGLDESEESASSDDDGDGVDDEQSMSSGDDEESGDAAAKNLEKESTREERREAQTMRKRKTKVKFNLQQTFFEMEGSSAKE